MKPKKTKQPAKSPKVFRYRILCASPTNEDGHFIEIIGGEEISPDPRDSFHPIECMVCRHVGFYRRSQYQLTN
jgi:hypothetical protein